MTDILHDLESVVAEIEGRTRNIMGGNELHLLLSRAIDEIERLRKANSDRA